MPYIVLALLERPGKKISIGWEEPAWHIFMTHWATTLEYLLDPVHGKYPCGKPIEKQDFRYPANHIIVTHVGGWMGSVMLQHAIYFNI